MTDSQRELQQAIRNHNIHGLRKLLDQVAPADGLLVDAVETGNAKTVELLLDAGAVPGSRPLVVTVARRGSLAIVRLFIRRCPRHVLRFGEQALQAASDRGHRAAYEKLAAFLRAVQRFACRTGP
jgi:hypothetical protein